MAEEKKQTPEVKQAKETKEPGEATPRKVSLFSKLRDRFGKLKKYSIPVFSALGAFALSAVIYIFVLSDRPASVEQPAESVRTGMEETKAGKAGRDTTGTEKAKPPAQVDSSPAKKASPRPGEKQLTKEDVTGIEIDTTEIMKELEFLFYTPDMEAGELGITAEDSIDTLNWIQKEMARLSEVNAEHEKRLRELQELERKIDEAMVKIEQAESTRMVKLARLYDGMKPDEVAKLFANLDDDMIVTLLPRMKPANAAKILGLLPPKRAARISTQMITVLED